MADSPHQWREPLAVGRIDRPCPHPKCDERFLAPGAAARHYERHHAGRGGRYRAADSHRQRPVARGAD